MFDDISQKNSAPPNNLPTEPEDMFAAVDQNAAPVDEAPTALDAGILRKKLAAAPKVQTAPQDFQETGYAVSEPVLGKVIKVIIFLVIAAVVGYGAWRIYAFVNGPGEVQNIAESQIVTTTPIVTEEPEVVDSTSTTTEEDLGAVQIITTTTPEVATQTDQNIVDEWVDTDKDGLTDTREEELGTNSLKPDTDDDGLADGDEVFIWKTDPLNPDTDGDNYLDGDEVRHGYSPLGPGKLFGTPTPTTTSSTLVSPTTTIDEDDFVI
jgi:hypothetical protein